MEAKIFVAEPAWQAEISAAKRVHSPWSVAYFLLRHLRTHYGQTVLSDDCIIYVGLFLDHKSSRLLTHRANQLNKQWLRNRSSFLPLRDGTLLDLGPALSSGRVWVASYGPERCRIMNASPLRAARRVYFDRAFGACDEARGVMAPAYAAAAAVVQPRDRRRWRAGVSHALSSGGNRSTDIFFYGHVPKPYLDWPLSTVRYRIWRELHARREPRVVAGGVDVSVTVRPFAVASIAEKCVHCGYRCKRCYHDPEAPSYTDAPRLSPSAFFEAMLSSEWCVVARGDDPQTPKLTEAIIAGCLPVIVVDGPLPFAVEGWFNYSAGALRIATEDVLASPSILLNLIRSIDPTRRAGMRSYLRAHRRLFQYGRRDGMGAEAALTDAIISRSLDKSPTSNPVNAQMRRR